MSNISAASSITLRQLEGISRSAEEAGLQALKPQAAGFGGFLAGVLTRFKAKFMSSDTKVANIADLQAVKKSIVNVYGQHLDADIKDVRLLIGEAFNRHFVSAIETGHPVGEKEVNSFCFKQHGELKKLITEARREDPQNTSSVTGLQSNEGSIVDTVVSGISDPLHGMTSFGKGFANRLLGRTPSKSKLTAANLSQERSIPESAVATKELLQMKFAVGSQADQKAGSDTASTQSTRGYGKTKSSKR